MDFSTIYLKTALNFKNKISVREFCVETQGQNLKCSVFFLIDINCGKSLHRKKREKSSNYKQNTSFLH